MESNLCGRKATVKPTDGRKVPEALKHGGEIVAVYVGPKAGTVQVQLLGTGGYCHSFPILQVKIESAVQAQRRQFNALRLDELHADS